MVQISIHKYLSLQSSLPAGCAGIPVIAYFIFCIALIIIWPYFAYLLEDWELRAKLGLPCSLPGPNPGHTFPGGHSTYSLFSEPEADTGLPGQWKQEGELGVKSLVWLEPLLSHKFHVGDPLLPPTLPSLFPSF